MFNILISTEDKLKIDELVTQLQTKYEKLHFNFILNDIEDAIETYGIRVLWSNMEGFPKRKRGIIRGYITERNNQPEIVINGDLNKLEQRYTIAYLFGVLVILHSWDEQSEVSKNTCYLKDDTRNSVLDYFSLRLLINEDYYQSIKELQNKFNIKTKSELSRVLKVREEELTRYNTYLELKKI